MPDICKQKGTYTKKKKNPKPHPNKQNKDDASLKSVFSRK